MVGGRLGVEIFDVLGEWGAFGAVHGFPPGILAIALS